MAVKSIIDIQVDTDDWVRFQKTFNDYTEQLKASTEVWETVNRSSREVALTFEGLAAVMLTHTQRLHEHRQELDAANRTTTKMGHTWQGMVRTTKSVATNIIDATRSLLRWGTVLSAVSGVLGFGGLFGIARLAQNTGQSRRQSLGFGVSPGEKSAFDITYGRLFNTEGFLGGVNEALTTAAKRSDLIRGGLRPEEIDAGDTVKTSMRLIERMKDIVDRTPVAMLGDVARALGWENFGVDANGARALKNTPRAEIEDYAKSIAARTKALEVDKATAKAYQDLDVALKLAKASIENAFVTGLAPIIPKIKALSDNFSKLVIALGQSPVIKGWIEDISVGLQELADYIKRPEFKAAVEGFLARLEHIAEKLWEFAKKVAGIIGYLDDLIPTPKSQEDFNKKYETPGTPENDEKNLPGGSGWRWDPRKQWLPFWEDAPSGTHAPALPPPEPWDLHKLNPFNWFNGTGGPGFSPEGDYGPGEFSNADKFSSLPPGLLKTVAFVESGGNPNAVGPMTSSGQAKGMFQFTDATARRYGITDQFDPNQEAVGASHYLSDLLREFHGNVAEAAAGYNWGEGNVEKALKEYGADWLSHAPLETQKYVQKVESGVARASFTRTPHVTTNLNVYNNTGANVAISAAQLAT